MKIIYADKIVISKSDNKTHKKIIFNTDRNMKNLIIEFEYNPHIVDNIEDIEEAFSCKEVEYLKAPFINDKKSLNNLITLSLYDEDEYIGCAHRHRQFQKIVISESESTEGFKKSKIKASVWELIISIHAAYSEEIELSINIYTN